MRIIRTLLTDTKDSLFASLGHCVNHNVVDFDPIFLGPSFLEPPLIRDQLPRVSFEVVKAEHLIVRNVLAVFPKALFHSAEDYLGRHPGLNVTFLRETEIDVGSESIFKS